MIESRGWPHVDDLFGGREIGQSDQVSFLILIVPRLLLRERRSSAEWRRSTLGGPSRVSRSAQMQALSMPRQITKRKIQSVDFVQGLRVKRSPYGGLYANDCTFNGNTCHSAWGPNADRRTNSLNCPRKEGQPLKPIYRGRPHLPADLYRHLRQGHPRQAL